MEVTDVVRFTNLALSASLMYVAMMRVVRDWSYWNRRERVVRTHLTAYLFVMGYGTTEALRDGSPPGARVFLILTVHTSFALWLWITRRDPARPGEGQPLPAPASRS